MFVDLKTGRETNRDSIYGEVEAQIPVLQEIEEDLTILVTTLKFLPFNPKSLFGNTFPFMCQSLL